jgi:hypothetical protein
MIFPERRESCQSKQPAESHVTESRRASPVEAVEAAVGFCEISQGAARRPHIPKSRNAANRAAQGEMRYWARECCWPGQPLGPQISASSFEGLRDEADWTGAYQGRFQPRDAFTQEPWSRRASGCMSQPRKGKRPTSAALLTST